MVCGLRLFGVFSSSAMQSGLALCRRSATLTGGHTPYLELPLRNEAQKE